MTDNFLFADKACTSATPVKSLNPFRILIVDDDEEIHAITKMALSDFCLHGRHLEFVSAYSGEEARRLLSESNDFALVLLDVVMEHDHAGLEVAQWIRESLQNRIIRIVLRTGQPGQAPEEDIIARYEIDDYKEKTELTYRKLVTLMYSSLRAYSELCRVERNRKALEHIIQASAKLFSASSVKELSRGILEQLVAFVTHANTAAYCAFDGMSASGSKAGNLKVLAGVGRYEHDEGRIITQQLAQDVIEELAQRQDSVCFTIADQDYYGLYRTSTGHYYLLYIHGIVKANSNQLSEDDQHLLTLFMNNTAIAFEHAQNSNIHPPA